MTAKILLNLAFCSILPALSFFNLELDYREDIS